MYLLSPSCSTELYHFWFVDAINFIRTSSSTSRSRISLRESAVDTWAMWITHVSQRKKNTHRHSKNAIEQMIDVSSWHWKLVFLWLRRLYLKRVNYVFHMLVTAAWNEISSLQVDKFFMTFFADTCIRLRFALIFVYRFCLLIHKWYVCRCFQGSIQTVYRKKGIKYAIDFAWIDISEFFL